MKDVPIFPNSSFVFEENIDDEIAFKFLSGVISYRLPPNSNHLSVFSYKTKFLSEFDRIVNLIRRIRNNESGILLDKRRRKRSKNIFKI